MIQVTVEGLGTIPARTKVDVTLLTTGNLKNGDVLDARNMDLHYTCIDCGYETADVNLMLEHQRNQRKYHSWWCRFKRWWKKNE